MFLTEEAVRPALDGVAVGVACDGCPALPDLMKRYQAAGGRYYVCPICFNAKKLDEGQLIEGGELQGTVPMWAWIGTRPLCPSATDRPRRATARVHPTYSPEWRSGSATAL